MAARRRQRSFWIPDSAVALRYYARQKDHEEAVRAYQQQQIKRLLFELGMPSSRNVQALSRFGKD